MTDVFDMQDEIAQAVAAALQGRIFAAPAQRPSGKPTTNIEAYTLLLRARRDVYRLDPERLRSAEEQLRRVIALDPQYADGYALLAYCVLSAAIMGAPGSILPEAAEASRKALEIAPGNALALACSAIANAALDWNWREFDRMMRQAYALAPDDSEVANWCALLYLRYKGQYREALEIYDGIRWRDPLAANWPAYQCVIAYHARDYQLAKDYALKALNIDSSQMIAHWLMCAIAAQTEDVERALASGAEALRLSGHNDWVRGTLAIALASAGRLAEALAIRDDLLEAARSRYVSPIATMTACSAIGDADGTLLAMEQIAEQRLVHVLWLPDYSQCDFVRRNPRCSALLARVGLPERF